MSARGRLLVVVALATSLLAACSPRLVGTPDDAREVTARFATVENLVVGHAVQLADVRIGTVTSVGLDGHEAVVTLAIDPTVHLPEGTEAAIRRTSLLGEDYVQLSLPDVEDVAALPAVADGGELPTGRGVPDLEEVTHRALELLAAVSTDDVDTIVESSVQALQGREDQLGDLVVELAEVTDHYADQRERIGAVIDQLGGLGGELAAGRQEVVTLIDDVEAATAALARQRERITVGLQAVDRIRDAAAGSLLGDTQDEFAATLAELGPVAEQLASDRERVDQLIDRVLGFVDRILRTVRADELELYGLITSGPHGAGVPTGADALRGLLEPSP